MKIFIGEQAVKVSTQEGLDKQLSGRGVRCLVDEDKCEIVELSDLAEGGKYIVGSTLNRGQGLENMGDVAKAVPNTAPAAGCPHANTTPVEIKNVGVCPFGYGKEESKEDEANDKPPSVHYHGYLGLDRVLDSQKLRSEEVTGKPVHDEMLFIIIHQTYELWFKQMIWDIDSVLKLFSKVELPHADMCVITQRLKRVVEIQKVMADQFQILETMTPLSFLDFRQYLGTSSGFQSHQFRLFEIKLGLRREKRMKFAGKVYSEALLDRHKQKVLDVEEELSLFDAINAWLARTPAILSQGFDFWEEYKKSVRGMLEKDRQNIKRNPDMTEEQKTKALTGLETSANNFEILFDEDKYNELVRTGKKRLSYKAAIAALMITAYQEEPLFHMPHTLLCLLLDIDENMRTWRYKHALMVHRMLGMKIGSGGSSGYHYLKATASNHQVFNDFFDLSMFLIPRAFLPKLPANVQSHFGFFFESTAAESRK